MGWEGIGLDSVGKIELSEFLGALSSERFAGLLLSPVVAREAFV